MKKIPALLLLALLCIQAQAQNTRWSVTRQKNYSQSHPIGTETLQLRNSFGKMELKTWDRNEVKVDAVITVSAMENDYALKLLEAIKIVDNKAADAISFKTQIGDEDRGWNGNQSSEMHIDYTVYFPAHARLDARNMFGNMLIGDYSGEGELVSMHGSFTGGKLSNLKKLTVQFGKANIQSLSNTDILFQHSVIDIAEINGDLKGQINFCDGVDLLLGSQAKSIDLKSQHSSLYFFLEKNKNLEYDINTNNGIATGKGDIRLQEVNETTGNVRSIGYRPNHRYTGKLGSGNGSKLQVSTSFGNVRLL
jgi:hypothetical protein